MIENENNINDVIIHMMMLLAKDFNLVFPRQSKFTVGMVADEASAFELTDYLTPNCLQLQPCVVNCPLLLVIFFRVKNF